MSKERDLIAVVERILLEKLKEFDEAGQTGVVSIDVQVVDGKPTTINAYTGDWLGRTSSMGTGMDSDAK